MNGRVGRRRCPAGPRPVTARGVSLAVVVGLLLVVAAAACSGPETQQEAVPTTYPTAAKRVAAAEWLPAACAAIIDVRGIVADALVLPDGQELVVDGDEADREAARDALAGALGDTADALFDVDRTLADVGVPDSPAGDDLQSQLRAGIAELAGRYTTAASAVADAPVASAAEFRESVTASIGRLDASYGRLGEVVDQLRADPSYSELIVAEPACSGL